MVAHFTLRTNDESKVFFRKKNGFDDSFDVTKCLQPIEMPDLPSNIKTMGIRISFFGFQIQA